MSLVVIFCCVVALVGHLCIASKQASSFGTVKGDGPASMTFKAPNISEEEAHSNFMPEQLKCDACRIVAYQVSVESYSFYWIGTVVAIILLLLQCLWVLFSDPRDAE